MGMRVQVLSQSRTSISLLLLLLLLARVGWHGSPAAYLAAGLPGEVCALGTLLISLAAISWSLQPTYLHAVTITVVCMWYNFITMRMGILFADACLRNSFNKSNNHSVKACMSAVLMNSTLFPVQLSETGHLCATI